MNHLKVTCFFSPLLSKFTNITDAKRSNIPINRNALEDSFKNSNPYTGGINNEYCVNKDVSESEPFEIARNEQTDASIRCQRYYFGNL